MQLHERLKFLRTHRRLKLRELSERTGLSIPHISDMERGACNPSIKTCQKMANAYGVTLTLLFSGVEVDVVQ